MIYLGNYGRQNIGSLVINSLDQAVGYAVKLLTLTKPLLLKMELCPT